MVQPYLTQSTPKCCRSRVWPTDMNVEVSGTGRRPAPETSSVERPVFAGIAKELTMKLAVGGDHAGFPIKGPVIDFLRAQGHEIQDFGTPSPEPVDFPDIARLVCGAVRSGTAERGV